MRGNGEDPHGSISIISNSRPNVIKKPRVKRIRKYFREYCENTGIHGMKYVTEKRSLCER